MKETKLRRKLTSKIAELYKAMPKGETQTQFFKRISEETANKSDVDRLLQYAQTDDRHFSRDLGNVSRWDILDLLIINRLSTEEPTVENFDTIPQVKHGRYTADFSTGRGLGGKISSGKKQGIIEINDVIPLDEEGDELEDDDGNKITLDRKKQIALQISEEHSEFDSNVDKLFFTFEYPVILEKLYGGRGFKYMPLKNYDVEELSATTLDNSDVITYLQLVAKSTRKSNKSSLGLLVPKLGVHSIQNQFFNNKIVNPYLIDLLRTSPENLIDNIFSKVVQDSYAPDSSLVEIFSEAKTKKEKSRWDSQKEDYLYLRREVWEGVKSLVASVKEGNMDSISWISKLPEEAKTELKEEVDSLPFDNEGVWEDAATSQNIKSAAGITRLSKNDLTFFLEDENILQFIESSKGLTPSVPIKNPKMSMFLKSQSDRQIFSLFANQIDSSTKGVFEYDERAMSLAYEPKKDALVALKVFLNMTYLLDESMEQSVIDLEKQVEEYLKVDSETQRAQLTAIKTAIDKFISNLDTSLNSVIQTLKDGIQNKLKDIATRQNEYVNEIGEKLYEELEDKGLLSARG